MICWLGTLLEAQINKLGTFGMLKPGMPARKFLQHLFQCAQLSHYIYLHLPAGELSPCCGRPDLSQEARNSGQSAPQKV